jgi:signal transduction histidine kinase
VVQGYEQLMMDGQLGPITLEQRAALESIARSVLDLTRIAENATRMAQITGERLVLAREMQEVSPLIEEAVQTACAEAPTRRLRISASVEPDIGHAAWTGRALCTRSRTWCGTASDSLRMAARSP